MINFKLRIIDTKFLKSGYISEIIVSIAAGLSAFIWGLFFTPETALIDARINLRKNLTEIVLKIKDDNKIAVVVIPENVLIKYNHPAITPRDYLAELNDAISYYKPKVIAYDYIFDQPSDRSNDEKLYTSLKSAGNVVIGYQMVETISGYKCGITDTLSYFREAAYGAGFSNIGKDENNIVRYNNFSQGAETSFACEILSCYFNQEPSRLIENQFILSNNTKDFFIKKYKIPKNAFFNEQLISYDTSINHKFFTIHESDEILEIFRNSKDFLQGVFEDKIVIIGDSGYNRDIHKTPIYGSSGYQNSYGVLLQANVVRNYLNKNFITRSNTLVNILLAVIFTLSTAFFAYFFTFKKFFISFFSIIAGYLALSFILFILFNILLPVIIILSAVIVTSLLIIMVRAAYSEKHKNIVT